MKASVVTVAAGGLSALRCDSSPPDEVFVDVSFPQGLASGDPRQDSVIIWTRVETANNVAVPVTFEVALDEEFQQVVAQGTSDVDDSTDHTLRVKVTDLEPSTRYFYRFRSQAVTSETGRTKTAPNADDDVPVRLAVVYGQSYVGRYFNSWQTLLEQEDEIDFILFLGDYVYEADIIEGAQDPTADRSFQFPDGLPLGGTPEDGTVAYTLADYRLLYKTWRSDVQLRRVHQMYPFITVWDDHEFANDCWQDYANNFDGAAGSEQDRERREAATRAWYEYIPIDVDYRPEAGFPDDIRIYRTFRFGRHMELFLTDQRYYRDDHVIPEGPADPEVGKVQENSILGSRILAIKEPFDLREADAAPTMLGEEQFDWLVDQVTSSQATWKILGSQTIFAQMALDLTGNDTVPAPFQQRFYFKLDQWDGYRSERARLLSSLSDVENFVILTGDIHASYTSDLHVDFDEPGAQPTTVEYIGPSLSAVSIQEQLMLAVTADPLLSLFGLEELVTQADSIFLESNPHFHYSNSHSYGYTIVDIDRDQEVRVTMAHLSDVITPGVTSPVERVSFRTPLGSNRIERT